MGFYDAEVKRVCFGCKRLLVMAINSIFKKSHNVDEEVVYLNEELPGDDNSLFMDMLIQIEDCKYHMEFQLLEGNMAIRMYEYAVRETIREIDGTDADRYEIDVVMPQQTVIFLAGNNKRNEIKVNLTLPDMQKVSYYLPCISASRTVESLCRDQLYIFLPFQQVQENQRMLEIGRKSNIAKKEMARRLVELRVSVRNQLEKLMRDGTIKENEYDILTECCSNIESYLKDKDVTVKREVLDMGDADYVALSDRLRAEGKEEGIKEGKIELLVTMVNEGDITVEKAAERIGISADEFRNMMKRTKLA